MIISRRQAYVNGFGTAFQRFSMLSYPQHNHPVLAHIDPSPAAHQDATPKDQSLRFGSISRSFSFRISKKRSQPTSVSASFICGLRILCSLRPPIWG
jgi:hypothetical protein